MANTSFRSFSSCTRSSILLFRYRHLSQTHKGGQLSLPLRYMTSPVRHMGFFQEFSKRLKGELEKNPELQKSIQELKVNSVDLQSRTKETMNVISKHINSLRENTELRARQVSSVIMDKIHETKKAASGVTSQVKESVHLKNNRGAEFVEPNKGDSTSSATASSSGNEEHYSKPDAKNSPKLSHAFNVFSSSTSTLFDRIRMTVPLTFVKQGYDMVREELDSTSSKRAKEKVKAKAKHYAASTAPKSSCTDVVPVVRKQTLWEKRWDFFKTKAESNRIYKRFKGVKKHPLYVKGQEIAEDIRERWETSDSPMVHRIQDLNESIFGETATAMALKEIRKRDMTFSFPDFLAEVQENARDVLQAYLKGDIEELQKRCTREVIDRCRAERRAYESQGIFFDNKILHISDIELRDTKLMGNVPIIIVTFQTQQVFCVRDKYGKITQGAKDDILTVHYAWAMQQVSPEEMDDDELFPQWQLREMQQLGVRAII